MKIVLLAMGSRGDVQPLLALGKGLIKAGYDITLVAGADFRGFVEGAGVPYLALNVSMQEMMNSEAGKEWTGNSSDNPLNEARNMRRMLMSVSESMEADLLRVTADADVIVSGLPVFIFAEAIAEKYKKRHITIQFVPFNPTKEGRATMQPILPLRQTILNRLSGYIGQYFTHWIFKDAGNAFRQRLGMEPMPYREYTRAYNRDVPVIYGLSKHVITEPSDWHSNKFITGYWFYDAPSDWQASDELLAFLATGEKPVYLGFGSMSNKNPEETTQIMIDALKHSGKRGIIYSGWAGLNADNLSDDIFLLDGAPHDWLFPRMAGVVHHGGAGTTAAGLRAGVPSLVVSHMADQPYWGRRIHELGVGAMFIRRHELTTERLATAIRDMTANPQITRNAQALAHKIRQEDGVAEAIRVFDGLLR